MDVDDLHGVDWYVKACGPTGAETAVARRLRASGAILYDVTNGHSSLAFVRHGSGFRNARFNPTVVEKAFA